MTTTTSDLPSDLPPSDAPTPLVEELFVIHPDASAVMGDGRVLVALHNAQGDVTAVESEKPELAAVVMGFARPMPLSSLGERFPYFPRESLATAVDLLRVSGVLIEASELVTGASVEHEMMADSARAIADAAGTIEADVTSMGATSGAVTLRRRLRSVEAQVKLVATEIKMRRMRSMNPPR